MNCFRSFIQAFERPGGILGFFFSVFGASANAPTIEADIKLKENDRVGVTLIVLHTPGHTPGSNLSVRLWEETNLRWRRDYQQRWKILGLSLPNHSKEYCGS
jgi:hypothetical protein